MSRRRGLLAGLLSVACTLAFAGSDPFIDASELGGAALGGAVRMEQSPYRGVGTRADVVPLYLYEGKYTYMHGYRAGFKLDQGKAHRLDVFLSRRFEGFPYDRIPASLAGMASRDPGLDLGVGYTHRADWGSVFAEALHDTGDSGGNELKVGYNYEWESGRLKLRPYATLSARSASLNNYYYGVRPGEAAAGRPAYAPGSGVNAQLALYSSYDLSNRWRFLAGISAMRWSKGVRASPIVEDRSQNALILGLAYDFTPAAKPWAEDTPRRVKVSYGKASDCSLIPIARLSCTSTSTVEQTRTVGIEVGRPFIEGLHGWPLDFVGYLGLVRHQERGFQDDSWQVNAYMKALWYGLPWNERVSTRVGLGFGFSYAQKIPYLEARTQASVGKNTSNFLNYIDPTIDFSVGDLTGIKALKKTYLGMGVAHRSGIFGTSTLLGHVDGGSNYIYTYLEWEM